MRRRGERPEPGEDNEDAALLKRRGEVHEAAHLERLEASGWSAFAIPRDDLTADADAT